MSEELRDENNVMLTSFTGPAYMGEDRRCIQITGGCGAPTGVGYVQLDKQQALVVAETLLDWLVTTGVLKSRQIALKEPA